MNEFIKKQNAAHDAYLAKFNAAHPNNEAFRPEVVQEIECPSLANAEPIGEAYGLPDGRVVKRNMVSGRCTYLVYASREAYFNFREPLSWNQYYFG